MRKGESSFIKEMVVRFRQEDVDSMKEICSLTGILKEAEVLRYCIKMGLNCARRLAPEPEPGDIEPDVPLEP